MKHKANVSKLINCYSDILPLSYIRPSGSDRIHKFSTHFLIFLCLKFIWTHLLIFVLPPFQMGFVITLFCTLLMFTNHRKCQFSHMLVKTPSGEHLVAYDVRHPFNTFIQKKHAYAWLSAILKLQIVWPRCIALQWTDRLIATSEESRDF